MTLKKAKLVEIEWRNRQQEAVDVSEGKRVEVHFNPQSLRVNYANQNRGGNQPQGSARQFVGARTTRLSVELLFDTTHDGSDVRRFTADVAYFMQPPRPAAGGGGGGRGGGRQRGNRVPPGVRFEWGSFIFRGVVDSMDETLDYFSDDGVPLRATISLTISRQDIEFPQGEAGRGGGGGRPTRPAPPAGGPQPGGPQPSGPAAGQPPRQSGAPVTEPPAPARTGDSVQRLAARNGRSNDWRSIAAANDIDDPLRIPPGRLINLNPRGR